MSFRDTLHHFKNYFGATIATKALTLISIPVLTRWLGVTPEDYGYISLFTTYVGIFICLVTLNTYIGAGRYYYENKSDFKQFFGTTVNLNIFLLVVVGVGAMFFIGWGSSVLDITPLMYVLMIPAIIFSIAGSLFGQIFQARQDSKKVARYSIATAYVGFGLSVIFTILNPDNKYLGSIYSQVIVGGLFMYYIVRQLRPYYVFAFRKVDIRYMLSYSVPLIPYFLSSIILGQFDRVMIANYTNVSDAGLYSFAYNIGMLFTLFFSSLNSAWAPKFYSIMQSKNYVEYDKQVNFMNRLMLCVALLLIYFGGELGMLLGSESFHPALPIIPIVVIGYLFFAYFYYWQWNIDFAKKTLYSSLVVGLAGGINIGLNVIFIPLYGYVAAAYTTMVSYLMMAVFAWAVNKFILKIYSVKARSLIKLFMFFLLFVFGYFAVLELDHFVEILIKLLLSATFCYLCFKPQIHSVFNRR